VTAGLLEGIKADDASAAPPTPAAIRELGLLDFVPRLSPRYERPDHLAPVAELFERIERGEEVYAVVSIPPRHGKTELLLHVIAWLLARHPEWTIGYSTYGADLARSKSRFARDYARRAGVELARDSAALHEWRTPAGGGLLAAGVGGPLTGHGLQLGIVDDPHKNRAEAESKTVRDHVFDWFTSTFATRLEPGASAIVNMARWHEDDLAGRLAAETEHEWQIVNLPAIDEAGRALWGSRWPVEKLERRKRLVGKYDWSSLYQGRPRPRGGAVFEGVHFYDAPPATGYREAIGVDLAYSKKTAADFSVVIVVARCGDLYYVLDVIRVQAKAPAFADRLAVVRAARPWAPCRWYCTGAEIGVADLVNAAHKRIRIEAVTTTADKFVRAQPTAALWNAGQVLVPREAPWLNDFISEVVGFTGLDDDHDDQVDALAAAVDALPDLPASAGTVASSGRRRLAGRSSDL